MINATLRDMIICSACGALVYLPTVRVYKGYVWSGKCCPVCTEPLSESLKPIKTEKIEPSMKQCAGHPIRHEVITYIAYGQDKEDCPLCRALNEIEVHRFNEREI
jgi:rubrerythrin